MLTKLTTTNEIAEGGIKAFETNGTEILVCKSNGSFYAVERRCGHMNAPCEMGTLHDYILTCPMHYAQFDIKTGKVLKQPFMKSEPQGLPDKFQNFFEHKEELVSKINTCALKTFTVVITGEDVCVEITSL